MSGTALRVFSYRFVIRSAVAGAAALAAWSCGSATDGPTTSAVASVVVTPTAATLLVGQQQPLQAAVSDGAGNAVAGATVVWSVRDAGIASVSPTGVVTALAIGATEVAANVNGKSAIAAITVQRAPVASVVVLPLHVDAFVGARTTFTAIAYDGAGIQLSGRTFIWATSNTAVATVDAAGSVTAVAPGSATLTATAEGKSNSATITVTLTPVANVTVTPPVLSMSPGETTSFTAVARDSAGNVLTGRLVTWSSSNNGVASVSSAGKVTGIADGTATITANIGGVAGSATLTISSSPVGSVTVQPTTLTLTQNTSQQLSAVVRDVDDQILPRLVTWSTSNPGLATVTAAGVVAGLNPGAVTITATSGGQSGTADVTVVKATVISLTLQPSPASIRVGTTMTVTATPKDASGLPLTGHVVTWKSSSNQIATVTSAGAVTGVAPGRATITATCEGVNATVTVDVGVPVGSVSLAPATANLPVGLTLTLAPTVKDANGTVTTDRVIAWTSSAPAVATVSTTGVVIGVTAGTSTITATSEGKSGTASITVIVPPVFTVTVQPPTVTLVVGRTTTLAAVNRDENGNVLIGRLVLWSVGDASIVTVSASGVVTAVGAGTTTVTATSEGKSGTSIVTVTLVPVATVTIQPSNATVAAGGTTTLTSFTRDASGNVLTGRVVTWSSNNPGIATVTSAGVVTGVNHGSATITATSEGKSGTATVTVP